VCAYYIQQYGIFVPISVSTKQNEAIVKLNIPQKYQKDIEKATTLLKNEGCAAVYLFGSMVTGKIRENSDIDIGIKGLPPGNFFRVYAKLDDNVDLVDFDANYKLYDLLESLGEVVEVG
jgi:predicted nucleotidyltransferase